MDYRNLGHSGLKVSPICLGTMMFGDRTSADEAARIVASARAAGVNFIDTADVYAKGESERITGSLIGPHRSRWVLATKVANPMGEGPNDRGLSRVHMARALDASLDRLHTEYIDLYYLHKDDVATPLEETLRAMDDFIREGKVRYWALSNFRAWRIAEVMRLADRLNMPRPVALQPYYNAMNRTPEVEVLPACAYYGLGVVPYSPLARGVLTGKYALDAEPPAESRAGRQDKRMMQTEFRKESMQHAQAMAAHARERGATPGQFATAWVLNNRLVTSVIVGPRTNAQLDDYLGALDYRFTPEDEALVDSLVAPGHASTPGYTDPIYPVTGRMPRPVQD